jgi:hypothetical protein
MSPSHLQQVTKPSPETARTTQGAPGRQHSTHRITPWGKREPLSPSADHQAVGPRLPARPKEPPGRQHSTD